MYDLSLGPHPLISTSFSFFPSSGSHTQTHGSGWYQCMRFYFQARGFPKPAMYNNILFLGINAMLNYLLVFGGPSFLHWDGLGFIGAAISLSVSRTLQGVFYYLYMFVYQKHHITAWPDEGWSLTIHTRERTTEFMKQALPNIGTLLFQSCTYFIRPTSLCCANCLNSMLYSIFSWCFFSRLLSSSLIELFSFDLFSFSIYPVASQAQTVLVGRLGQLSIASSSALSTVTIPWSGTLSATCCTVSGVRVGYHLGRGNSTAARKSSWLVMYFITAMNGVMAIFFLAPYFRNKIMTIATDDEDVITMVRCQCPSRFDFYHHHHHFNTIKLGARGFSLYKIVFVYFSLFLFCLIGENIDSCHAGVDVSESDGKQRNVRNIYGTRPTVDRHHIIVRVRTTIVHRWCCDICAVHAWKFVRRVLVGCN